MLPTVKLQHAAWVLVLAGCPRYTTPPSPENEAYRMLTAIERGARNAFEKETALGAAGPYVHRFCPSTVTPHAPGAPWDDPAWLCLRVSSNEAHKFTYEYRSNGKDGADAEFTAVASRKLESGRFQSITLVVRGKATGDVERMSLTTTEH